MGPRKRSKPNPKEEALRDGTSELPKEQPKNSITSPEKPSEGSTTRADVSRRSSLAPGTSSPSSGSTWQGGTWPRGNKSLPVTQVARESITSVGNAASNAILSARASTPPITSPLRSPAAYLARHVTSSSRSISTNSLKSVDQNQVPTDTSSETLETGALEAQPSKGKVGDTHKTSPVEKEANTSTAADEERQGSQIDLAKNNGQDEGKAPVDSPGWMAWFSRAEHETKGKTQDELLTIRKDQDENVQIASKDSVLAGNSMPDPSQDPGNSRNEQRQSWLSFFSTTKANEPTQQSSAEAGLTEPEQAAQSSKTEDNQDQSPQNTRDEPSTAATKSYGWAFWSRDDQKVAEGKGLAPASVGELAQAGSPSQSKPESDVLNEAKGVPNKLAKQASAQNSNLSDVSAIRDGQEIATSLQSDSPSIQTKTEASTSKSKVKAATENLLLPPFKNTYRAAVRPGLIQQLSRLLQLGQAPEPKHVDLCNPPRIKKALAIGVHGYFPVPLIRSVLGQPTGTSIRFANNAATAIQKWIQTQGYSCEVEKVALEGEGKIAERVDLLWKLLLNWIEKIRSADFIMISCHSQGVPVAVMLIAKLIAFGCINSTRVGVCAMAGVNLGPFGDYKSRWIGGSAGELFDFGRPDSQVSKDYETALDTVLRFGVRICFVGSIDDQLVSLDSSTFGTLSHPHVYRAVFVDGRIHVSDFLTHLVGFALKLRNLGVPDHGLIRELSSPLAGSLYTGEGHSRIYEDEAVYYLAVEYALETTSLGANIPIQIQKPLTAAGTTVSVSGGAGGNTGGSSSSTGPLTISGSSGSGGSSSNPQNNPYILPFAMRGLLEEEYVKTELYEEITELIKQFDNWKPTSKALKDVKFRLEGVRSKL